MNTTEVRSLVSKLCVQLGFSLSPQDIESLCENPPASVDEFVDRVFEAEGLRSDGSLKLKRQVRDLVAKHFAFPNHPN